MPLLTRSTWVRYEPGADDPWDLRKVAHLHRRAGFGATRAELIRDRDAGPAASVDRLLSPPETPTDEREAAEGLRATARTTGNIDLLKVCWLNRILHGSDPLREKLTLFWHGHFATSQKKVKSARFMDGQNETIRNHALGDFATLLNAMTVDPAMLVWLDGVGSSKARPNENLAREFLELFALGPGHYTEADVREAARAFTGWVREGREGQFGTRPVRREASEVDEGEKTFLGRSGRWGSADVVRLALERPEAAVHLARALYRGFVGEAAEPGPELLDPLADELREHGYSIRHAVEMILRSRHFYAKGIHRQRVKSPVEFGAGLLRALEVPRTDLNPLALAAACDAQGQELFAPPNVMGWEGGKTWINSATLLQRENWSADVVWGRPEQGLPPFDPLAWASHHEVPPARAAEAWIDLLLQDDLNGEARTLILREGRDIRPDGLRKALQLIINCPEFQLA
ncbi:MAG: hypothetical protein QOE66_1432 [Chloroflexota bacterium]|nr:hypothetical protein [Chloroflexota bacterium]